MRSALSDVVIGLGIAALGGLIYLVFGALEGSGAEIKDLVVGACWLIGAIMFFLGVFKLAGALRKPSRPGS